LQINEKFPTFKRKFQNVWLIDIIIQNVIVNVKGNTIKANKVLNDGMSSLNF